MRDFSFYRSRPGDRSGPALQRLSKAFDKLLAFMDEPQTFDRGFPSEELVRLAKCLQETHGAMKEVGVEDAQDHVDVLAGSSDGLPIWLLKVSRYGHPTTSLDEQIGPYLRMTLERAIDPKVTWWDCRQYFKQFKEALLAGLSSQSDTSKKIRTHHRPRNLDELKSVHKKVKRGIARNESQADVVREFVEKEYPQLKTEKAIKARTNALIRALNRNKDLFT